MIRHNTAGAALAVASLALASPAWAQKGLERQLAGIRLNTSLKSVMAKYGNPTQTIVGEVGYRVPDAAGRVFAQPGSGAPGSPSGPSASPGSPSGPSPFPAAPSGASPFPGGLPPLGGSASPGSPFGGFAGAPSPGPEGGAAGMPGGTGGSARQQEATLVYDRPGISYEFLIGPEGRVIQIKAIGYGRKANVRTQLGVGLGATYDQVLRRYGYPEDQMQIQVQGSQVLVVSYRNNAHVSFQFRNGKVIAITIASVEAEDVLQRPLVAPGGRPPGAPGGVPRE